jgi:hypothetical protein
MESDGGKGSRAALLVALWGNTSFVPLRLAFRDVARKLKLERDDRRANEGGEEVGGTLVRWQPVFPSDFPPPDAGLRRTGRNGQGCRVTAEAVDRLFVHVNGNSWDQEGYEETRGEPALRPVKSPALPSQVRILSLPHYL